MPLVNYRPCSREIMDLVASVHLPVCPSVCALLFEPIGSGPDYRPRSEGDDGFNTF